MAEDGLLEPTKDMNQFTWFGYRGTGTPIPKSWRLKVMLSGKVILSNAGMLDVVLGYRKGIKTPIRDGGIPKFNLQFKGNKDVLPGFPNESSKWVWLAGIIDAECSLSLIRCTKDTRRGFQYLPRLSCSSTTPILLLQMKKVCHPFATMSSHHYQDKRSPFWKSTRKLSVTSNGLRHILPKVLPYLVVKRKRAEKLLEALSLLEVCPKKGDAKSYVERKLSGCLKDMKIMNKRGK